MSFGLYGATAAYQATNDASHALAYGWDEDFGGFYRENTTLGKGAGSEAAAYKTRGL